MDDRLLGMSGGELEHALDDAVAMQADSIRTDLPWDVISPSADGADRWSRFDRILDAAEDRGLDVLPVLTGTPEWATAPECSDDSCPPVDPAEFALFAGRAVARYGDRISVWEVWDEPNQADSWAQPDPLTYARLLSLTTSAIKEADAEATVLLGGLGLHDETTPAHVATVTYLDRVCDTGACDGIDGVALHPETAPESAPDDLEDTIPWDAITGAEDSVASVLDEHGRSDAGIWLTTYTAPIEAASAPTTEPAPVPGPAPAPVPAPEQAPVPAPALVSVPALVPMDGGPSADLPLAPSTGTSTGTGTEEQQPSAPAAQSTEASAGEAPSDAASFGSAPADRPNTSPSTDDPEDTALSTTEEAATSPSPVARTAVAPILTILGTLLTGVLTALGVVFVAARRRLNGV